ncbi:MAG: hypothetical protein DIU78_013150 [Pseudomonadota bacterium]
MNDESWSGLVGRIVNQRREMYAAAARLRRAALAIEEASVYGAAAASAAVQAEHAELGLLLKDLVVKLDHQAELDELMGEDEHAAE